LGLTAELPNMVDAEGGGEEARRCEGVERFLGRGRGGPFMAGRTCTDAERGAHASCVSEAIMWCGGRYFMNSRKYLSEYRGRNAGPGLEVFTVLTKSNSLSLILLCVECCSILQTLYAQSICVRYIRRISAPTRRSLRLRGSRAHNP
jgi:hypothetical protein